METERVLVKSVELVAWRYNGEPDKAWPEWVRAKVVGIGHMSIIINSEHGELRARVGDWITRDIGGDVAVASADQFARRYHQLSSDASAVALAIHTGPVFLPAAWNPVLVERAASAFHNASKDDAGWEPWPELDESEREQLRLATRMALTAAIKV